MTTFASFFSCAGGADLGAIQAGCIPVGAVELDPYPAALHRANFDGEMREENILDTPLNVFTGVDFLWASPSCKSFSTAKENAGERQADVAIAKKVAALIGSIKPRYFALENVRGYLYQPEEKLEELLSLEAEEQGFTLTAPTVKTKKRLKARDFTESFGVIYRQLESMGYNLHYDIYDAANYGACQNRDRLILRASRDKLMLLQSTHCKSGGLFLRPWNGWYDAIADLLPSCRQTHLTEKQIQSLINKGYYGIIEKALLAGNEYIGRNGKIGHGDDLPSGTVTGQYKPAAILIEGKDSPSRDRTVREADEPCPTITSNQGGGGRLPKAVLVSGTGNQYCSSHTIRDGDAPSITVTANMDRNVNRAIILERTGYGHGRDPQLRTADEPTWTLRSATGCDEKGGYRSPITALLEHADVRALDYRCLARFQGFPDSYKWGKSAGKNCEAIGNAVEVGMARSVLESMI
jgi:site-specific DNA-cytosine methylase